MCWLLMKCVVFSKHLLYSSTKLFWDYLVIMCPFLSLYLFIRILKVSRSKDKKLSIANITNNAKKIWDPDAIEKSNIKTLVMGKIRSCAIPFAILST